MPDEAVAAVADPVEAVESDLGADVAQAEGVGREAGESGGDNPEQTDGAAAKEAQSDGRMLSPDVRAHLSELKATNPALAGKIRDAFGQAQAIRKEFPGGLSEARSAKQLAEQIGGADGVKEIQSRLGEIEELDRLWDAKDPRAVDSMVEDYPEQFAALMPHALGQWQRSDPDGFNRNACGIVAATFQAANDDGVSALNLMWMADQALASGNNEQAKAIVSDLLTWARSFARAANAPPKAKAQTESNGSEAETLRQQLRDQKASAFNQAVGTAVETYTDSRIESALAPYIKGKALTPGQRSTLNQRVINLVGARLQKDGSFTNGLRQYTEAGDQSGLVAMSKAKIDALLPGAAKDAYRWLFGGSAPQKTPAKAAAQAATNATAAGSAQKPWIKVSSPPRPSDVDAGRTSFEMKMKSSAILHDGRRVYWGQQPYQGK